LYQGEKCRPRYNELAANPYGLDFAGANEVVPGALADAVLPGFGRAYKRFLLLNAHSLKPPVTYAVCLLRMAALWSTYSVCVKRTPTVCVILSLLVTINQAVRDLRKRLDLSQQAFATRLGLSISAIQNYEKERKPDARALYALMMHAQRSGRPDLENVFRTELGRELNAKSSAEMDYMLNTMALEGLRNRLRELQAEYKSDPQTQGAIQADIEYLDARAPVAGIPELLDNLTDAVAVLSKSKRLNDEEASAVETLDIGFAHLLRAVGWLVQKYEISLLNPAARKVALMDPEVGWLRQKHERHNNKTPKKRG
jgi:transcriptional regulator with XRE-family HTH domain